MTLLTLLALACSGRPVDDSEAPEDTALQLAEAVSGESCDPTERVGWISLTPSNDQVWVNGVVMDAPDPFTGLPVLDNGACAYHRYDASVCAQCPDGLYCGADGTCALPVGAVADTRVEVSVAGERWDIEADPVTGLLNGQVSDLDQAYAMEIAFGRDRVSVPAMPIARGDVSVSVTVEGSSEAPGALEASWTPFDDGSVVRSEIPINHHAQPGTFTLCEAGAEVGGFLADAEMIEPLAVITGLEFQGVEHLHVASAQTSSGCLELRFGTSQHVDPSFEH